MDLHVVCHAVLHVMFTGGCNSQIGKYGWPCPPSLPHSYSTKPYKPRPHPSNTQQRQMARRRTGTLDTIALVIRRAANGLVAPTACIRKVVATPVEPCMLAATARA